MAFRMKSLKVPPAPTDAPTSMIASAARVDVAMARWPLYRYTDEAWQRESWGFYECNGELSYVADYIGAAQSLVRFYARHVDANGVPQGEVHDDPEIAALMSGMLGGAAKRANVMRALSIGLTVAGDTYLIGRAARPGFGDQWTVVASHFVRMYGGIVQVDFGLGRWEDLDPNRDIVIRVWRQSPQRPLLASSATRPLLLTFTQLQKLRMFMLAEFNSRIAAGGGVLPLPAGLDFPGDADNDIPPGTPGVAQMIYEAAASNIEGEGTAAAIAPVIFEVPREVLGDMPREPIRFDIPLSEHLPERYAMLIGSIARGMNVPSDVVEGMAKSNHWQSWWSTEEFTTKTIAPDSTLICDALNEGWFYGALKKVGKDPARFTIWFDLAPLSNTADKFTDTLNLYREGAVSLETLLASANYTLANAPDEKEFLVRQMWEVIKRDPTQLQSEGLRKWIGLNIPDFVPQLDTGTDMNQLPPPPPAPDKVPVARQVGTKPEKPDAGSALVDDLEASVIRPHAMLPISHAVVTAALAVAGRRLLTAPFRMAFRDTDPILMHTKIKVGSVDKARELLSTTDQTIQASLNRFAPDASQLARDLTQYMEGLLVNGIPHSPELLSAFLAGRR